jgi:hypothetical protein
VRPEPADDEVEGRRGVEQIDVDRRQVRWRRVDDRLIREDLVDPQRQDRADEHEAGDHHPQEEHRREPRAQLAQKPTCHGFSSDIEAAKVGPSITARRTLSPFPPWADGPPLSSCSTTVS